MCDIIVNDIFDELKDQNQKLSQDLRFEKNLNQILEKIKTISMILKNNCICSENIEVFRQLNDLEIDYKLLKAKRNERPVNHYSPRHSSPLFQRLTSGLNGSRKSDIGEPSGSTSSPTVKDTLRNSIDSNEVDVFVHTFTCNECQINFGSASDLDLHINYIHNKPEDIDKITPKSGFRTITDYLRSYRKESKSAAPDVKDDHQSSSNVADKKSHNFNFITEMMKKKSKCVALKTMNKEQASHKCPVCTAICPTKTNLEKHSRKFHPDYRPFKCGFNGCNLAYYRKNHLLEHQRNKRHFDSLAASGSVNTALAIGLNVDGLDMNQDINESNTIVKNESFEPYIKTEPEDIKPLIAQMPAVKMEMISDSENELELNERLAPYEAVVPHSSFNKGNLLTRKALGQSILISSPQMKFNCDICGKNFTRKDSLTKHRRTIHSRTNNSARNVRSVKPVRSVRRSIPSNVDVNKGQNGLFKCDKCSYTTPKRQLLSRHSICHSNVKPYKCTVDKCNYSAKRRDILNAHIRRVHHVFSFPNQYVCTFPNCKLRFANQMRLRQHSMAHKNKFMCRWMGCNFKTDTFAKLMDHKRREKHTKPEHM